MSRKISSVILGLIMMVILAGASTPANAQVVVAVGGHRHHRHYHHRHYYHHR